MRGALFTAKPHKWAKLSGILRSALRERGEGALKIFARQQRSLQKISRIEIGTRRTRPGVWCDGERRTGKASIPCRLKMHLRRPQASSVSACFGGLGGRCAKVLGGFFYEKLLDP